jgi:glycine/D-amino acid oxidase-like deaminating enzyme
VRSFWLEQALDAEPASPVPLDHDLRTDVCIVGGGFTGLWAALELKSRDPSVDVTLVEADLCGSGASGRNGGFVMTWMSKASTLLKICGGQEGVRLLRESEHAVRAIGDFCNEHGLGAHGARVTADTVVLALNAWAHELPVFRRSILPIASDVAMTRAVPERLEEIGLHTGIAISDSRLLVDYYRSTPDGRLCFGKGGGAIPFAGRLGGRYDDASPRRGELAREIAHYDPSLADVGIAAAWRGPATRTATGLPHFGRLPGAAAIVYGHGYTGNGVGPSHLGGKFLASLALGAKDDWTESPMVEQRPARFLPPEPARYLGGQLVRAAARRKEMAEDAGRAPARLDTALAGLAPSGLAPVGKN